jgi:hypothetical protein
LFREEDQLIKGVYLLLQGQEPIWSNNDISMRTQISFDWLGTWRIVMLPLSRALWGTLERPIEIFSRKGFYRPFTGISGLLDVGLLYSAAR